MGLSVEDLVSRWVGSPTTIRADLLALIGIGLALTVTIHVLLRKREVGGAIGWIGLVWLSPLFGAALYAMFGVNRVTRRARKLRTKPSDQNAAGLRAEPVAAPLPEAFRPLDHAIRQITQLPLEGGNRVHPMRNGDAAYPVMLEAIAGATRSVALSSYIFADDETGRAFADALAGALGRGVDVRVLVDGIGSGYFFPGIYRRLHQAGIPTGRFMHATLPWRMPFLNMRTHKKLLIIDGRIGFTGGINIAQGNRVAQRPAHPIRDTHLRIEGPVVDQLTAAFAADWAFVMGDEPEGEAWYPPLAPVGGTLARVVTSGPDADIRKIETVVIQAITCARSSIRLATPYFLPSEMVTHALALAALRGLTVDVVIPRASDHRFVDWATRAHVDPLIASGVRIWLDAPPFDHSKILVVDEAWCFLGSANWDMRSFRLNFELNVELYDADLAARLTGFIREKMTERLERSDLARRSLPVRLRDAGVRLALPYL